MSDFEQDLIFSELFSEKSKIFAKGQLQCITKDSQKAKNLRVEGNNIYTTAQSDKRKLEESFERYSKSIAFAVKDSKELACAYGNRSALLLRIGKYRECLLDLNRALEINYSDAAFRIKLLCRKIECMAALGLPNCDKIFSEITQLVQEMPDLNNPMTKQLDAARNALSNVDKMNSLKKNNVVLAEHKKILLEREGQNYSAVKYNDKFGRHLVANKDLKPGEIIFVEKPYVSCLNPAFSHVYCSHCFKETWASIPCDSCNWSMFCSTKCKNLAWSSYHNIECTAVSYLTYNNYKVDYYDLLSLRALILGVREAGDIDSFKKDIQAINKWTERYEEEKNSNNLFQDGLYFSNGFKSIYTLCSDVPNRYLRDHASNIVFILIILSKYTSFFGESIKVREAADIQENKNMMFIGSVLLKLWKRSIASTQTVHKPNDLCKSPFNLINCKSSNCSVSACIPSMTFFMNHSCYPNARKYITEDQKVIVFALRPIRRNSEIRISYQHAFYDKEHSIRHSMMRQFLNFNCNCKACKFNWPTLVQLYKMPKENPFLYTKNFIKEESDLYDENDALVSPIINNHSTRISQATIRKLSKAMEKAVSCLEQPSIVICELMICLGKSFEILYSSN